jgi:nicotinamidase-related amidase
MSQIRISDASSIVAFTAFEHYFYKNDLRAEEMMLKSEQAVLVVVDVQGRLASLMYQKDEFFKNVTRMIEAAKVLGIPILWNEQLPDKLGATVPEIAAALSPRTPLAKSTFSCCGNDTFLSSLKTLRRKQVLLVGMETHVCVYQTALDLIPLGFEVHLVADAVSSRSLDNRQIGIAAIRDMGACITSVEMCLFEMLRVAQGDEFRRIIQIVK